MSRVRDIAVTFHCGYTKGLLGPSSREIYYTFCLLWFCPSGRFEEIPDGAPEQRRKSGEVPGRAEETASEKSARQQERIQVQR